MGTSSCGGISLGRTALPTVSNAAVSARSLASAACSAPANTGRTGAWTRLCAAGRASRRPAQAVTLRLDKNQTTPIAKHSYKTARGASAQAHGISAACAAVKQKTVQKAPLYRKAPAKSPAAAYTSATEGAPDTVRSIARPEIRPAAQP